MSLTGSGAVSRSASSRVLLAISAASRCASATSAGHRRSAVPGSRRIEVATQVSDTTAPHRPGLDYDLA